MREALEQLVLDGSLILAFAACIVTLVWVFINMCYDIYDFLREVGRRTREWITEWRRGGA